MVRPCDLLPALLDIAIKHVGAALTAVARRLTVHRHATAAIAAGPSPHHSRVEERRLSSRHPALRRGARAAAAATDVAGPAPADVVHGRNVAVPAQLALEFLVEAEDGALRGREDVARAAAAGHGDLAVRAVGGGFAGLCRRRGVAVGGEEGCKGAEGWTLGIGAAGDRGRRGGFHGVAGAPAACGDVVVL